MSNTNPTLRQILDSYASHIDSGWLGATKHQNSMNKDEALQAILTYFEGLAPEKPVQQWDGEDGFCSTCEAFLEDEKYRCYCDIRNETIDQYLTNIRKAE